MFEQTSKKEREMMVNNTNNRRPSSGAGPTPFHRRSSWLAIDVNKTPLFKWHIYDNKGSYNGWFDWIPEWMRVGYWSPVAVIFLICFYISLYIYMPQPLVFDITTTTTTTITTTDDGFWYWRYADAAVCAWGIFVIVQATISMGSIGAFFISYTGWSWILLTVRPLLAIVSSFLSQNHPNISSKLAIIASSLRFPVVVAAFVTFTIWNFVLLPMIYFIATPPGKPREKFLQFNFSFFMTNVHVLNLPLSLVNIIFGDNIRLFTMSDLWVSYVIVMLYSILYLFVMDRIGLHFYPIFCPRTALCALSFGLVLYLYYFLLQMGNDLIVYLHPELFVTTTTTTTITTGL